MLFAFFLRAAPRGLLLRERAPKGLLLRPLWPNVGHPPGAAAAAAASSGFLLRLPLTPRGQGLPDHSSRTMGGGAAAAAWQCLPRLRPPFAPRGRGLRGPSRSGPPGAAFAAAAAPLRPGRLLCLQPKPRTGPSPDPELRPLRGCRLPARDPRVWPQAAPGRRELSTHPAARIRHTLLPLLLPLLFAARWSAASGVSPPNAPPPVPNPGGANRRCRSNTKWGGLCCQGMAVEAAVRGRGGFPLHTPQWLAAAAAPPPATPPRTGEVAQRRPGRPKWRRNRVPRFSACRGCWRKVATRGRSRTPRCRSRGCPGPR